MFKVKKLSPNAVIPKRAKPGDAGLDITVTSKVISDTQVTYGTGLAFEIPEGYVGLLVPRSSIYKYDLSLSNSCGILDSGYRGEVKAVFNIKPGSHPLLFKDYEVGERAFQLVVVPFFVQDPIEVDDLSDTVRGTGGYGSSGAW